MLVNCCYRLIPTGEVIHSFLDTATGIIQGMPEAYMEHDCASIHKSEYNPYQYVGKDTPYDSICETILLQDSLHALVVEFATIGFDICTFNGVWKFVESPLGEYNNLGLGTKPMSENFAYIGYRPTKVRQFGACKGIYRLCYDKVNNKIVTQDGSLTPLFDVDKLSKISYNYEGYKDMVSNGEYAVVYMEDKPVFLDIDKNDMTIFFKGGK